MKDDNERTEDSPVNDIAFFEGRRNRGRGRYTDPPGDYRPFEEVIEEASRKILPCLFDNAGNRIVKD